MFDHFPFNMRLSALGSFLSCFVLFGCVTTKEINNKYKDMHSKHLSDAEKTLSSGYRALTDLPIPMNFRARNPNYEKCDEDRWALVNQAPLAVRRACASVMDANNIINVVKKLINTPARFRDGVEMLPAKKYSRRHEMNVEVIVDNFSRKISGGLLYDLSTNVKVSVILRSLKNGHEVKGSGSKAINEVPLGSRFAMQSNSAIVYLLALNGALYEALGEAYSKLPSHITHYLVASKNGEIASIPDKAVEPPEEKGRDRKTPDKSSHSLASSGSGFFVSKLGHVVTNAHVVKDCKKVSVGDNSKNLVPAKIIATDKLNDLALLKLSSLDTASDASKSLIRKLAIKVVPLAANGLLRSRDVKLGEKVLVAGYPYGDIFSDTIKVTSGIVSASRGSGDNSAQFQMDAAVQSGNSGGPIYDSGGNIVGVVVSQLNKLKVAKAIGTLPENVNFGIKASTVRTFLTSSGLPSKIAKRTGVMSTVELAEIAQKQALMVMCQQ
jgi:S1-C subfamily serine protease